MAKLPAARVIRDRPWPTTDVLAPAPRRIPPRLWIRITFGGSLGQAGWFAVALTAWIMAIVGMRLDANRDRTDDLPAPWVIAIIVLSCTPLLATAAWRAHKQLYLLRHGRETRGKLLGKREVDSSDSSYWHYTFEYTASGGATQVVTVVTDVPEPQLEDDALEPMVYDPSGRREATTLDHLPGYPAITGQGELIARNPRIWHVLLLPIVAIAGIVTVLAVIV